jgi:hypothetical protein
MRGERGLAGVSGQFGAGIVGENTPISLFRVKSRPDFSTLLMASGDFELPIRPMATTNVKGLFFFLKQ